MAFFKEIYDKRGRLPSPTIFLIINNVSKYRKESDLSQDKRFDQYFKLDVLDFMSKVEKAAKEGILMN